MLPRKEYEICKCCGGTGTQTRKDGLRVLCPCCGGSGNGKRINYDTPPDRSKPIKFIG